MTTSIGRRVATGLLLAMLLTGCTESGSGSGMILSDDDDPGASGRPTAPSSTGKPAPAEVPTETHSGKNVGEFTTSWPAGEPGYLTFDCPKCSGNVVVETDGSEHLLINAIGAYHGTRWFNVSPGAATKTIKVTSANAAWTATIADFRSVPMTELGKPMSGKGDAVVRVPPGTANAELTGKGPGNFQVWVTVGDTIDLPVNEIGDFTTKIPLQGPAFVEIGEWEGSWTIKPS